MYINVNNIKLHYEVIGKGQPIILLNGNGTSSGYMKIIGNKLADDYMVYIVDRRCSGKSTRDCKLTYEDTAEDIIEFIKALNINKPTLLGHSGGATVVLHLATKYQDYLSKIVLCSGEARYDKEFPKSLFIRFVEFMPFFPGKKSYERFLELVNNARGFTKEELNKIKVPTLIINGENDIIEKEEAEFMRDSITNSELLILKGATHQSYMMKINWDKELKSFLKK